jgi:DNA-directed RNA polymerase subunit RPC12/RpoP
MGAERTIRCWSCGTEVHLEPSYTLDVSEMRLIRCTLCDSLVGTIRIQVEPMRTEDFFPKRQRPVAPPMARPTQFRSAEFLCVRCEVKLKVTQPLPPTGWPDENLACDRCRGKLVRVSDWTEKEEV